MLTIWRSRWLLANFLQREIHGRYIGTATGLFWALLHPLALLGIYAVVFELIFKVRLSEFGEHGFIAFVALGIWPWLAFQEGISRGLVSVQGGAALIKKVAFPHELLVYSSVIGPAIIHGAGLILALLVIAASGLPLHLQALPLLLVPMLTIAIIAAGGSLLLSASQVFIRDLEQLMVPVMMVGFYATPILYSSSMMPENVRRIFQLNPMAYLIGRVREIMMQGVGLQWEDAMAFFLALVFLVCARWFFLRLSPHFEDYI